MTHLDYNRATDEYGTTNILAVGESCAILVDSAENAWTFEDWDGDERVPATVEHIDNYTYKITADMYYSPEGRLELAITQPLERAIRTFVALLKADTHEEVYR